MNKQLQHLARLCVKNSKNHTSFAIPDIPKNISSRNELYDWIIYHTHIPWIQLPIYLYVGEILKEIKDVEAKGYFTSHRYEQDEHNNWTSFCIHGKSWDSTKEDAHYNNNKPHSFTKEAKELMPYTVNLLQNNWFGNEFQRVRIMRLGPDGWITAHSDGECSKFFPINIAITQPDNCDFAYPDFGIIPYKVGSSFLMNISPQHCVVNDSKLVRYHIIIHSSVVTDQYKDFIITTYKNACDRGKVIF